MSESQRHNALLDLLNQKGSITVSNVIDKFGVSPATARRDINKLDEKGKLKKVRNGAQVVDQKRTYWSPMNIHQTLNHEEKVRIAHRAADMCAPGDSIVINSGSTAFLLGKEICGRDVQVITNYFPLMSYLIKEGHDGVVIVGGQYHKTRSLILAPHQEMTSFYTGHYMFTSGTGLTAKGLYKMDMLSAMAEQKMLNQVGKLVALVDSSKLGQRAGMLFAAAEQLDVVITGEDANPEVVKELEELGIEVVLA